MKQNPTPTAHTPGPWAKDYTLSGQLIIKGASPYTGKPFARKVATISDHSKSANGQRETDANAALIASAPELLAVLKIAVSYLEANRPKGKIREIFTQLNEYENGVLKPARAAIAQAEGGAQ